MSKEPTPLEKLLLKLEGKVPDDLLEEVNDFLYEQEEELKERELKIDGLKEEVEDLEDQVRDAEEGSELDFHKVEDWITSCSGGPSKDDKKSLLEILTDELAGEGTPILTLPDSRDAMQAILIPKLEEYINQHGVEDTLEKLTQDHSQEVEELRERVYDLEHTKVTLEMELEEAQQDLEKYAQF